jgi:hypothetical protein
MDEGGVLSFLSRRLGPSFVTRIVDIVPGSWRAYHGGEWRNAIVVVERGEIELECVTGSRQRLARGAVLWLAGLPLRALRNPGLERAVVVAVSRRPEPANPPRRPRRGSDGSCRARAPRFD